MKVTEMQAAIGCAQLKKLPSFGVARRKNFSRMIEGLSDLGDKFILPEPCANSDPSWFGFLLTCREGVERSEVVKFIESRNVQTRMLFAGNLIKHPCFDEMRSSGAGYRVVGSLENTDRIMRDTFWIGVYPGMTDGMIDFMIETVRAAIGRS